MSSKTVTVQNAIGLHARPVSFFIQKANSFRSSIWVELGSRRMNAKSLLGILSMGIGCGTTITLLADGPDEDEALDALVDLINRGCEE